MVTLADTNEERVVKLDGIRKVLDESVHKMEMEKILTQKKKSASAKRQARIPESETTTRKSSRTTKIPAKLKE